MNISLKITLLLSLTVYVNSLNILALFPYHGLSHFLVFRVYLRELANRGHNVTVVSHFPETNPLKNYHDISLAGTVKIIHDDVPPERSFLTLLLIAWYLSSTGIENCEIMLANKQVQNMIREKQKFDVVVVESFNSDCALGVAYKLEAPVVSMTSHVLMPWQYARLGIAYNPAYVSFHFLDGGTKPSFFQRLERVFLNTYFKLTFYLITQKENQKTLAKYFDDVPPLEELGREIKFYLLYQNFVLTGSCLYPANVIEVGGYHVMKAKALEGSLKKFVDEATYGIIYISFGSVIKSSTLAKDKFEAILAVTKELPQRFIWKWEDETLLVDKDKLYTAKWLPQVDILGHPKTLAFFSHAGMGGTTEAIHYGVPVVAMPIFGDQPSNAAAIEESGLGVILQMTDLTKESLLAALKKVLDPRFRQQAREISKAWHNRPLSPLDTAVFWTEFAATHPNMTFRTAAADVPLYLYLNIDIVLVFTVILSIFILSVRLCCCRPKKQAIKTKSKKSKSA